MPDEARDFKIDPIFIEKGPKQNIVASHLLSDLLHGGSVLHLLLGQLCLRVYRLVNAGNGLWFLYPKEDNSS